MKRLETDAGWTAIDDYIADCLIPGDEALEAALQASEAAGLPAINVAPNQGKLLMLLARAIGARELTDLGTHAPAATLALTGKMLGRALLGVGQRAPIANCAIANVPGPKVPIYLNGARMTYFLSLP